MTARKPNLSPASLARADRQRLAAEEGARAMAEVEREALAVRKNMERLRALREARRRSGERCGACLIRAPAEARAPREADRALVRFDFQTARDVSARPRDAMRPSCATRSPSQEIGGRREGRAPIAPAASCAIGKHRS